MQLARQHDVEIAGKAVRDQLAHRDRTTRNGDHQRSPTAPGGKCLGQPFTCLDAIAKDHVQHLSPGAPCG